MNHGKLQINELTVILAEHFQWNKARIPCFVGMLVALIAVGTVNLTQLALVFPSRHGFHHATGGCNDFLAIIGWNYYEVAHFIMKLFSFTGNGYYLSLDRTNWKWGETNINLLVLAVVYRGAAIPVYWLPLNKRGNSNTRERIALMKRFIGQFGSQGIKGLLADREFIGDESMGWLLEKRIPFYIRIQNNTGSVNSQGKKVRVDRLFYAPKPVEVRTISSVRRLGTCSVYLSGLRLSDGGLLIVASHHSTPAAVKVYGFHWEIETLFGCLKGRGFKL